MSEVVESVVENSVDGARTPAAEPLRESEGAPVGESRDQYRETLSDRWLAIEVSVASIRMGIHNARIELDGIEDKREFALFHREMTAALVGAINNLYLIHAGVIVPELPEEDRPTANIISSVPTIVSTTGQPLSSI